MRNVFKRLHIGSAILSICLMISCGSDDDQTPISTSEVNIEEAKLSDFPLFGVTSTKVEIIDPEIINNKEVKPGEIKITVPSRTALDKISVHITSDELNLSKFSISPGNDVQLSYEDQKENVYAITTATGDKKGTTSLYR